MLPGYPTHCYSGRLLRHVAVSTESQCIAADEQTGAALVSGPASAATPEGSIFGALLTRSRRLRGKTCLRARVRLSASEYHRKKSIEELRHASIRLRAIDDRRGDGLG